MTKAQNKKSPQIKNILQMKKKNLPKQEYCPPPLFFPEKMNLKSLLFFFTYGKIFLPFFVSKK